MSSSSTFETRVEQALTGLLVAAGIAEDQIRPHYDSREKNAQLVVRATRGAEVIEYSGVYEIDVSISCRQRMTRRKTGSPPEDELDAIVRYVENVIDAPNLSGRLSTEGEPLDIHVYYSERQPTDRTPADDHFDTELNLTLEAMARTFDHALSDHNIT